MPRAETAALVAQLTLDDKGFNRGVDRAIKKSGQLDKTLSNVGSKAGRGLSTAAGNIAKITTIASVGAVGLLAKSVENASSLNEQINKTKAVFGDASKSVLAFSQTTADKLGLSRIEALTAAGAFGNMFKTTGLAEGKAADMSKTLVTLAADMASFNDEDPSEMLDKLRSGLSGEAEPLRRFGVLLSEARVKEEAYSTGIAKRGKALTEAQKVQARYSLILKDTAVQQGDFEKTAGGMANLMRRLKGNLTDASTVIGAALLPQIVNLAKKLNDLVVKNGPAIQDFANKLPGAFDKALAFAEKIPWGSIAAGLESAAHWAGVLFDAFLGLPPEVQTTIIALAGLNKLSGGAISGIASELGKGLIKGVLGINAGVVNVRAATVAGVGGGVAGAGAAGGATSTAGKIASAASKVFIIGAAAAFIAELGSIRGQQSEENKQGVENLGKQGEVFVKSASIDDMKKALEGIEGYERQLTNSLTPEAIAFQLDIDGVRTAVDAQEASLRAAIADLESSGRTNSAAENTAQNITNERLEAIEGQKTHIDAVKDAVHNSSSQNAAIATRNQAAAFAIRDKVATSGSLVTSAVNAVKTVAAATTSATQTVASRQNIANERLEAIRRKDFSPTVNISAKFSIQELSKGQKTFTKTFHSTLV